MIVLPNEIAAQMEALGLRVDHPVVVWDGPPDPAPAGCRFYVPAYMAGEWAMTAMADMPLLEVCQLPTAGYEHALMHLPPGVTLCNAAGVHDTSTAELAVGLILARLRCLDDGARAMSSGRFRHGRFEALADKHVVIIGAGGIGRALARRLEGFECHVTLVARTSRDGVRAREELPDLLPVADVVVLAVPLDETTRGLVDATFLKRMKDGSLLVNVARGAVADTDALLAEAGRLQFALDVTDPEPLPPGHPLWQSPGVLISPHVGGNTSAFLPRVARLVDEQARRWISGESVLHVIVS
ncbi:MAG: 2-hydroxyacid dehydrogenase [Candidatus Nanopelagicales bacterium]|nr:2-hydroxyacid dehydrogenase [Candidatus Nanopelagicales bacterium]MDP4905905.1 2-hydroxyacid dehydrogenase [Candidatus Nanopelagicales bacterium]MDP4975520.1 2-hydroxyacid dehydrogenase [Candidatus Nanopelagicales bacterium]MDP5094991.1 2-hydroxyacid dehydrogenase [Candidatus Nanopelagicales bacterium]